jgi:hypothetical protein
MVGRRVRMTETCWQQMANGRAHAYPTGSYYVRREQRTCWRLQRGQRDDVHDAMRWFAGVTLNRATRSRPTPWIG